MSLSVVEGGEIREHEAPPANRVVIVSGSRTHKHKRVPFVMSKLDEAHEAHPIGLLVEGGADGVDSYAREWAQDRGVWCVTVWALWNVLGKAAGPDRNERMLMMFPDAHVIAFPAPDSKGTVHMVALATEQGRNLTIHELE